jgi:hypothetical protein
MYPKKSESVPGIEKPLIPKAGNLSYGEKRCLGLYFQVFLADRAISYRIEFSAAAAGFQQVEITEIRVSLDIIQPEVNFCAAFRGFELENVYRILADIEAHAFFAIALRYGQSEMVCEEAALYEASGRKLEIKPAFGALQPSTPHYVPLHLEFGLFDEWCEILPHRGEAHFCLPFPESPGFAIEQILGIRHIFRRFLL